jgi:hypothetical protein
MPGHLGTEHHKLTTTFFLEDADKLGLNLAIIRYGGNFLRKRVCPCVVVHLRELTVVLSTPPWSYRTPVPQP